LRLTLDVMKISSMICNNPLIVIQTTIRLSIAWKVEVWQGLILDIFYTVKRMYYYGVFVRSSLYHGNDALTYSSSEKLAVGSLVEVQMQKQTVLGIVSAVESKPRFKTKDVTKVYNLPPLPKSSLRLHSWLKEYYPAPHGVITQHFLPPKLPDVVASEIDSVTPDKPSLKKLPALNKHQRSALDLITEPDTYILEGITGSGKTRIYIELCLKQIEAGRSSIILTPEISLTSQLMDNFKAVFGNRVILVHSSQTDKQRRAAWLRCLTAAEPLIVIGPRSALFSPIQNLGLIVVDESHEPAYKQEKAPHYHASRVAAQLASLTHSTLILGSATPSLSDYYLAKQKNKKIIKLSHLAINDEIPTTEVITVDLKQADLFVRSKELSQPLLQSIEKSLNQSEQTLLYLNRRGTARLILCKVCGWQALCINCHIPLIYHGDKHILQCHSCNYHTDVVKNCPNCGNPDIVYRAAGTKAIVDEVKRLFPSARIGRFDGDNTKAERFEDQYLKAKRGEIDILIGTQLLAKGLDLPKLSTLGILLADTSLYMPDFSSDERTFQLIRQVLGRVGRGHVKGYAVIQTYQPENEVIAAAIKGNYESFYEHEIVMREQFMFPPFCYLLKLTARRASSNAAEGAAEKLITELRAARYKVRIEGPAPSFYEHTMNKSNWQLVIKAKDRSQLVKIVHALPSGWSFDIDPIDLL